MVYYLLSDQLNSTARIVTSGRSIQADTYYYPYGGRRGGSDSSLTARRFAGQRHESALPGGEGLYNYGARWYDAQMGRFISADTVVPSPGNPQSLNRYAYASNSPTSRIDPTGHDDCMVGDCPSTPGAGGFVLPNIDVAPGNRRFSPSSSDAINWTTAHMDLIVAKSEEYKVSPVLVSGLITAEIDLDNTWYGIALDDFTRGAYRRRGNPVRTVLNDASKAWIAVVTNTNSSMGDRISGYTNVHHATYVIVEQYMRTQYGKASPYGTDKKEYLPYLLTSEGTIDFTARMALISIGKTMFNKRVYTWFLVLALIHPLLAGCSAARIQQLEAQVREVQKGLYTLQDAVLLDQFLHVGHKKYVAPDCIVAYLETAYGVNRPMASIIDKYYEKLTEEGWELNPLYALRRTNEDIYLRKNEQLELVIYSYTDPGRAPSTKLPPEASQYTTVYVVALTYSEPSSLECSV